MKKQSKHNNIGYIIKREDLHKLKIIDLLKELQNNLFEISIAELALSAFQQKFLKSLDASIGDWKCQTRTSMIIDKINNPESTNLIFFKAKKSTMNLKKITQNLLFQIKNMNPIEHQNLTRKKLNNLSLFNFLKEYDLNHNFPEIIKLIGLCFLTTTENHHLDIFHAQLVTTNKMKAIINQAKKTLCLLSIEHEQNLAKQYGGAELQKCLQQIEFKGMQHMTSLFAGFYAIFKKMKAENQPFLNHTIKFCSCGGVQSNPIKFFKPQKNIYQEFPLPEDHTQALTIIEAYQFLGTLHQLQDLLGISHDIPRFSKKMINKTCHCKNPTQHLNIDSIDESIMAFFAQHPQFTNGAEIDWQGLGLENSELKKEYDYLKTLKGFSREDMSKFQIIHMYPSTIADVLKEQEELQKQLGLPVNKKQD